MAWTIEFAPEAVRELKHLDRQAVRRVIRFLEERLAEHENPAVLGERLQGVRFTGLTRFRVGNYRIIAEIDEVIRIVLVVRVAHRREVYK